MSGLSFAGFYAGFYIIFNGFMRPSWKSQSRKSSVVVLSIAGILAGIGVAEGAHYLARIAGLVAADYPSCGGYSLPLGCYVYNPFVQTWFVATGCVTGAVAGITLGVRIQARVKPERLNQAKGSLSSA